MLCFAALGAGNGALFQLVPLRWPTTTAVAGSMIGEIGALGGGLVPNAMGLSKQYLGSYAWGFLLFAVLVARDARRDARHADPLDAYLGGERWRRARAAAATSEPSSRSGRPSDGQLSTAGAAARREQHVEQQRQQRELPQRRRIARHERRRQRRSQWSRSASLEGERELLSRFKAFLADCARRPSGRCGRARSARRDGAADGATGSRRNGAFW